MKELSVPENKAEWSGEERLRVVQTLNALPTAQFDELVCALAPPKGNIPKDGASQSQCSLALLEWVESPIGPGVQKLETPLSKVIAERAGISQKFLSFVVSGKITSETAAEIQAFVQLLRKKTGDESIDVAFYYEEGSITLVLMGSSEGLEKAQELYGAGELASLDIPFIEAVQPIENTTANARKARLLATLKLQRKASKLADYSAWARALARDLYSYLDHDHDLALTSASTLARDLDLCSIRNSDSALARALARNLYSTRNSARTRARDQALAHASNLASALVLDLTSTRDLASARTRARTLALVLDQALGLVARGSDRDLRLIDLTRADLRGANLRGLDLDGVNLANADLTHADLINANLAHVNLAHANLAHVNLANANLTHANLTHANLANSQVADTLFGDNPGLSESLKLDLMVGGAAFQNFPGPDAPSLVRV